MSIFDLDSDFGQDPNLDDYGAEEELDAEMDLLEQGLDDDIAYAEGAHYGVIAPENAPAVINKNLMQEIWMYPSGSMVSKVLRGWGYIPTPHTKEADDISNRLKAMIDETGWPESDTEAQVQMIAEAVADSIALEHMDSFDELEKAWAESDYENDGFVETAKGYMSGAMDAAIAWFTDDLPNVILSLPWFTENQLANQLALYLWAVNKIAGDNEVYKIILANALASDAIDIVDFANRGADLMDQAIHDPQSFAPLAPPQEYAPAPSDGWAEKYVTPENILLGGSVVMSFRGIVGAFSRLF